jgi:hypothetical protein
VNFNVRPQAGTLLQGGLSTGRLTTDNCEVVAKLPETMFGQQTLQVTNAAANVVPAQFCHEQEPLLTQVKLLGTYLVPKIEVQISGTLQSIPGQQIAANYVATNAQVAPSLGRALSGGAANVTVAILEPGSKYGDRRNQLDLRVAKVLRFSQMRTTLGIDIANATNANPVLTQNPAYAAWLTPQTILTARFVKFSAQLNF